MERIDSSDLEYPTFTVVIEWGRFLQTDEAWRTKTMLKRLNEQILQISEKISNAEIMIIFDPGEIGASEIKEFAIKQLLPCLKIINFRVIPSPGLLYYEMKNFAASQSSNELIILVDSDVIIDDSWLMEFLESFKNPKVNVVSGHTYLALNTLLEKVMALILFQPLSDVDYMYENLQLYGNNLAIRRKVFRSHPFPKLNAFHGHCLFLVNDLLKNNFRIYRQPKARVAHPMPVTFKQFLAWGLVQGLCWPEKRRAIGKANKLGLLTKNNPNSLRQIISRTRKRISYVGLSPKVIIASMGIIPSHFFLILVGIIMAKVWPNYYNYMVSKKWDLWL